MINKLGYIIYLFYIYTMIKIYRYEDANGMGVYNTVLENNIDFANLFSNLNSKHSGNKTTPPIHKDLVWNFCDADYYSACTSIKELRTWFKGFNKPLLDTKEVNLVEYSVKHIYKTRSGLQIGFLQSDVISKKIIK